MVSVSDDDISAGQQDKGSNVKTLQRRLAKLLEQDPIRAIIVLPTALKMLWSLANNSQTGLLLPLSVMLWSHCLKTLKSSNQKGEAPASPSFKFPQRVLPNGLEAHRRA